MAPDLEVPKYCKYMETPRQVRSSSPGYQCLARARLSAEAFRMRRRSTHVSLLRGTFNLTAAATFAMELKQDKMMP